MFRFLAALLAALMLAPAFGTTAASADTAGQISTRNIILYGLAAAAGIILYNNYEHKVQAANSVVGYTRDGGVIHGDGRITYPNGTVLYLGNGARQRCGYYGYMTPCVRGQTYAYHYRYRHGHRKRDRDDRGDQGDQNDG